MNIKVIINTGSIVPAHKISVALSPDMTVMDALTAAESRYEATPGSHFDNPFSVALLASAKHRCIIIERVGGITSNKDYHWKIVVVNSSHMVSK